MMTPVNRILWWASVKCEMKEIVVVYCGVIVKYEM